VYQITEVRQISLFSSFSWRQSGRIYTGCPRRNVPDFGRMFLMLKYTDINQNTYIQSWTFTKIMAREKFGILAVPRTVPVKLTRYPYTTHVRPWEWNAVTLRLHYERWVTCKELQKCPLCLYRKLHSNWRTLWTITVKQVLYFSTVM
jgi:hypothetical protein